MAVGTTSLKTVKVSKENATGTAAATKKVPETTEAPERHVADAAYCLTSRVAATLVDKSTPGDWQRFATGRGHNFAERSRAAGIAGRGRMGRSGSTRRFATIVVCRVAALSGSARNDLAWVNCWGRLPRRRSREQRRHADRLSGLVRRSQVPARWHMPPAGGPQESGRRLSLQRRRRPTDRSHRCRTERARRTQNGCRLGYVDVELLLCLGHVAGPCR